MTRRIDLATLDRVDAEATVVALVGDALELDDRMLTRLTERRAMFVAVSRVGVLEGACLAAALLCDLTAVGAASSVAFAGGSGDLAAGLVGRIGAAALPLLLRSGGSLSAAAALEAGVVDALVPDAADSLEWLDSWLSGRSLLALQSAAALIRRRGGDVSERWEFARLFAIGEPQRGLEHFLKKRRADFSETVEVETI